jgi:antitoxin HicB
MTEPLPRVTAAEVMQALARNGWYVARQSRHVILKHPTKPGMVPVPRHRTQTLKEEDAVQHPVGGESLDRAVSEVAVRRYTVVLTPDEEDGGYTVTVPAISGCFTEGDTVEEALENARDVIRLFLEELVASGQAIPGESRLIEPTLALVDV